MAQLQFWNPSLAADCGNLFLGDAYCVHGAQQPDGIARSDRVVERTAAGPGPTGNGLGFVRRLLENVEKRHAAPALPVQTPMPATGVPRGWPGLNSPRMAMGEGAKLPTRHEL